MARPPRALLLRGVLGGLLSLSVVAACGDDDAPAAEAPTAPPAAGPTPEPRRSGALLLQDVDGRVLTDALRGGTRATDLELRRVAVLGVARLHDPAAAALLRRGLRDPDPEVRRAASLGLGAYEDLAPEGAETALLAALAAERDLETRAAMTWDLGRIAGDAALPALREAVAANEPGVRAAGCEALGFYGLRNRVLPAPILRRIAARMVDDTDPTVRLACSYALTRLAPPLDAPEESRAIVEDLGRALADEDGEVRAMAVRALGRYPGAPMEALAARTADPDWRVAVQAFRALAKVGPAAEAPYARRLRARLDRALDPGTRIEGPEAHVALAALEAARPLARGSAMHGAAAQAFQRLGAVPAGQPVQRDQGLAHCAAAALVDVSRGWPTRLLAGCGLGQVSEEERQVAAAEVLATVEGADPERLALLRRLYGAGDARVRAAVMGAAPTVDPVAAGPLVLSALRSGDPGVVTAAAEALGALAPRWRGAGEEAAEAPVLSVRPAGAPAPRPPALRAGPSEREVSRALRAAGDHLRERDEAEGLQAWIGAVEATGLRAFDADLGALAAHPVLAVRRRARTALETLGAAAPPEGSPGPVGNALAAAAFPAPADALEAILTTSRGEVRIALRADLAPSTVARFVALAEEGFYDGLAFHRVVPAFVVQGGDPRGDGFGGPGWTQRCEDNRLAYVRGTVGMALAGRDTGGSQFFITHSAQPHLNGRYTAFGRVVAGMEAVDRLQQGDRIDRLRIVRARGAPAGR